jgi:hypothetical protein
MLWSPPLFSSALTPVAIFELPVVLNPSALKPVATSRER